MLNGVFVIPLSGRPVDLDPRVATLPQRATVPAGFVAGEENRLAAVGVLSLLDDDASRYNPLVLHGPTGTGKTHLARGIAEAWRQRIGRSVVYCVAADFARQYAEALQTQGLPELRATYCSAALLVIEDLDRLAGKTAAQEELARTLDAIGQAEGQVVVTASEAPGDIHGLLPSLRSRLEAGLLVPLSRPGLAARLVLLGQLAEQRGFELDSDARDLLATHLDGTVRELSAALLRLAEGSETPTQRITAAAVAEHLDRRRGQTEPVPVQAIAVATARHFAVRVAELRSPSRRRGIVHARGTAMYLCRELTDCSLERIGQYFGGRDHTTVLHACRKIEEQLDRDAETRDAIDKLRDRLTGGQVGATRTQMSREGSLRNRG